MLSEKNKDRLIRFLIVSGFIAAVLAAVEGRVEWVSSLCGFLGSGCRETEHVTLLKVPVALWGVAFYILLGAMLFFGRNVLFLAVMAGAGFELTLISAMVEMKIVCFFCLVNLGIVFILVLLTFDQPRMWQALTLTFFCFLVSDHLLLTSRAVSHGPVSVKAPEPSVVAVVGDREIKIRELEGPLSTKIYKLNNQIYALKKDRLDDLINTKLIEMDALEKGLSPEIVTYKIMSEVQVSDGEVESYYKEHLGDFSEWKGSVDELKARIRQFLIANRTKETMDAYTKPLREKYPVTVFLTPPPLPVTSVSEGDSPALGPADADVTVVEYSDYQCPSCRKAHDITKQIKKEYSGRIRWVFKDFPLDRHKNAKNMAEAARCAGEQGKFWEYQDILFSSNKNADQKELVRAGETLGLDPVVLNDCMDSDRYVHLVEKDKKEGREAGVSSTPTFVINGRMSPGYLNFKAFSNLIEQELNKSL